jgi:hypothetical protein
MMYLEASKAQVPFMNIYFTKLQGYRKHPGDIMSEAEKEKVIRPRDILLAVKDIDVSGKKIGKVTELI